MSPWTDKLDLLGKPHASYHRDGHHVALFPDGWWAYAAGYKYTPPGAARIGPEPEGPFPTLDKAKAYVESQGFHSVIPVEGIAS
jgi:hypothetical protein